MKCSCGGDTTVSDSRPEGDRQRMRYRKCLSCGASFKTYEIPVEELRRLAKESEGAPRRRSWRDKFHDLFLSSLDRRVEVENLLWSVAAGKRGPVEAAEARQLATKLGVPTEWLDVRSGAGEGGGRAA